MKIDQLRYFLEAAREEHIGRAAARVAISPSAVSRGIAELERELGRELFVKRGKNVSLTGCGRLLMERAETLLNGVDALRDELGSETAELSGHYRLASSHGVCARRLTQAWSRVQTENPRLSAELYSLRSADVARGAAEGAFDLGVCHNPQDGAELASRTLYKGRLLLAVRRGHPVLKLPPAARPAALSRWSAALPKAFGGIENCESHPAFRRYGIVPRADFMFDSYDAALARVRATDSWGLFPDLFLREDAPCAAPIAPPGWNAEFRVTAVWPKRRWLAKPLRLTLDALEAGLNGRKTA